MGFINGNTNSFEVFFTDLGLQTFYQNGLMENSLFFSASDDDANYATFLSKTYDPYNVVNNTNNVIQSIELDTNTTRSINNQHKVFTQTNKRGGVLNGKNFEKNFVNGDGTIIPKATKFSLLKINESTLKNYVVFEGDTTTQELNILSYRKINGVKQFNIKGVNGLYLSYPADLYVDKINDSNAYPQTQSDVDFIYTNSKFVLIPSTSINDEMKYYSGSNDRSVMNQVVTNSSIVRTDYLIQNEKYNITFDFQFTFNDINYYKPDIKINLYVILGKNKIPVTITTPGRTLRNTYALNVDDNTEIDNSLVEIIDGYKTLSILNNVPVQGYVNCSLPANVINLCKKGKDLTIFVDYNGKFGGAVVSSPVLKFNITNLSINFHGVSVSNPLTSTTPSPNTKTYNQYTTTSDKIYLLNKNTKSLKFNEIVFKDAILRNRNLTSLDKNLITSKVETSKNINELVYIKRTFLYKNQPIGRLDISYPYSYYNKENILILPFQSFPVSAQYTVLDPGGFFINHYYGQSVVEPNKRTGIIDVNFSVNCVSLKGLPINEDLTISINLINGGFIKPIVPSVDPNGCINPPANGTILRYEKVSDCYKRAVIADGNCGVTYGSDEYDPSYCSIPQKGTFDMRNGYGLYIKGIYGIGLPAFTYSTNDNTRTEFTDTIERQIIDVELEGYPQSDLSIALSINGNRQYCTIIDSNSLTYRLEIPVDVHPPHNITVSIEPGSC